MAAYTALEIAKWFLAYNEYKAQDGDAEPITNLKLQKLLYYAQGSHLAIYDTPLFYDDILAWRHGPVVDSVYQEYRRFGSSGIVFDDEYDFSAIDDLTANLLKEVYEVFGQYSAWKLREMTHEETPWRSTEQSDAIPQSIIRDYFKANYIE